MDRGKGWFWLTAGWVWPVLPVLAYYRGYWDALLYPYGAAAAFGIFGLCYLLTALLLSTRIRFLDAVFGHDRVMRYHARLASASFVLIVIHRTLKVWDGPIITPQTLIGTVSIVMIAAVIALTVLFMVKTVIHRAGFMRRLRTAVTSRPAADYSRLKILHNLLPFAAWAAAVHVLLASTTRGYPGRTVAVAVFALLTFVLYIRFKFIRPARLRRRIFTVTAVRRPGPGVTEIRMSGKLPAYLPGQFAYWRLNSRAVSREEHPFTISTSPEETEIGFSAKALGDYTLAVGEVRPGDTAVIDGPYGQFVLPRDTGVPVLFIAGGIGITPFRSMIRHMTDTHSLRSASLIWAVRRRSDLVYAGEFLDMERRLTSFRYKSVIEVQESLNVDGTVADYESGYVTSGLILGLKPELAEDGTAVYICGPDPMREAVLKILKGIGVPSSRIRFERFSLG